MGNNRRHARVSLAALLALGSMSSHASLASSWGGNAGYILNNFGSVDTQLLDETGGNPAGVPDALVTQTPTSALQQDLVLTAKGNGWTYEQALAQYRAAETIGDVALKVAKQRPDVFVGSALSKNPGDVPTLYVKGPADPVINRLVAASPMRILVNDRQPYSFAELEGRKLRVHRALEAQGFKYVSTSVNIAGGGAIPAGVAVRDGERAPRGADILASLPADIRSDVHLTILPSMPAVDEAAFGGMSLRDDGSVECTSGFSVQRISDGVFGVSGAGHCNGINGVHHSGQATHSAIGRGEHLGAYGDVEWYSTAEPEPDDFYATSTDIRDVEAVEPRASISLNESICAYGRVSNSRDCSLNVRDVSQACTNGGKLADRLVMMNGDTQNPGDSGGGWTYGNTAFGGHKGGCGPDFANLEVFSVADLFDEALGVRVTCGC